MNVLPQVANANHTASQEYLAMTIETSLLKLSVVRARLKSSLYGYASSSNSRFSIADSVEKMHSRLVTQQTALERQEQDMQGRLMEYQRLIELVDGKDGSFSQVVEDLTTVQRETEECRKDLRYGTH
ncbi:hypothetical protein BU17DRAFT_56973 [Hysterangium stoloniferum]|nr:hypothetical protein BU17DRAFT_56973 [Hysterangium stoloniferum]